MKNLLLTLQKIILTTTAALAIIVLAGTQNLFAQEQSAQESPAQELPSTCVPVPRQHAWARQMHEDCNKIAAAGTAKIVFLGDSITDHWRRPRDEDPSCGSRIWNETFVPMGAVNFGISSDRTENVLWRLENGNLGGNIKPKLVVMMIGTNNWNCPPADTAAGVKAIIKKIQELQPQAKILLLAIFPRGADKADPKRQINEKVNPMLKKLCDNKHVFWLDINHIFLEKKGKTKNQAMDKSTMNADLLHPNTEGYRRERDAILPTIKKLLK